MQRYTKDQAIELSNSQPAVLAGSSDGQHPLSHVLEDQRLWKYSGANADSLFEWQEGSPERWVGAPQCPLSDPPWFPWMVKDGILPLSNGKEYDLGNDFVSTLGLFE